MFVRGKPQPRKFQMKFITKWLTLFYLFFCSSAIHTYCTSISLNNTLVSFTCSCVILGSVRHCLCAINWGHLPADLGKESAKNLSKSFPSEGDTPYHTYKMQKIKNIYLKTWKKKTAEICKIILVRFMYYLIRFAELIMYSINWSIVESNAVKSKETRQNMKRCNINNTSITFGAPACK